MDPDSDNDGLSDGYEINNCVYGEDENECTSPNIADSDGDSLPDGDELIDDIGCFQVSHTLPDGSVDYRPLGAACPGSNVRATSGEGLP